MSILGIDPGSRMAGVAVVESPNELLLTDVWTPSHRKLEFDEKLYEFYRFILARINSSKPRLAVVELVAVSRNTGTVRTLGRYEGAAIIACRVSGIPIVEKRASTARKEALGKGDMNKDDVYKVVKRTFPDHEFRTKKLGGTDETDAVVLACSELKGGDA